MKTTFLNNIYVCTLCAAIFLLADAENATSSTEIDIVPGVEAINQLNKTNDRVLLKLQEAVLKDKRIRASYSVYRKNLNQIMYGKLPDDVKNMTDKQKEVVGGLFLAAVAIKNKAISQSFDDLLIPNTVNYVKLSPNILEVGISFKF
jgi:hypothetical protein